MPALDLGMLHHRSCNMQNMPKAGAVLGDLVGSRQQKGGSNQFALEETNIGFWLGGPLKRYQPVYPCVLCWLHK